VRAAALPGEWLRSNCRNPDNWCLGRLEPGRYSSQYFDPHVAEGEEWAPHFGALTYEVPSGWANAGDWPETYAILTQAAYEADMPTEGMAVADQISLWAQPAAASRNECEEAPEPGIGSGPDALADWLLDHEGLIATEGAAIAIDGRPARVIDLEVEPSWTQTCDPENPTVAVPLFVKEGGWHAAIAAGDRQRAVIADIGNDGAVVIFVDSFDPATLDDLVADAMPVIETFEFVDD
jgi:hypothetical protein